jgi:CO dehydrogenase maturation factor
MAPDGAPEAPNAAHDPNGHDEGLRLVVTGKGGVGKTTLTAAVARLLARDGRRVLAVDADAQLNLAAALGMPRDEAEHRVPLSHHHDYIAEKTGVQPGESGALVRLNPDVDDVVERFGQWGPDRVRFLAMGTLSGAGGGCLCPENTTLAQTIRAIGLRPGEAIVLDTQAGVEHFGRAIARGFGHAVVVTDPTYSGIGVALSAGRLARDLGIPAVHLVVNRVRDDADRDRAEADLARRADGIRFDTSTWLPYDVAVLDAEPSVETLLDARSPFMTAVRALVATVARTPVEVAP